MALQLNEQIVPYKEFYGRNTEQMPLLVAEGRSPQSVAGLMQRRLETLSSSAEVKDAWWNNYFDTGDGILYHPDGKIKIVPDAKAAREMTAKSELQNGALVLPEGMYEALQGQEFSKEQLTKYIKTEFTKDGAKGNPIWQALARDSALLNAYVDAVFSQSKYDNNMGLYVGSAQNVPTMRLWNVRRLDNRSNANGRNHLDDDNGRLFGVAPEARAAQNKQAPTLEAKLA